MKIAFVVAKPTQFEVPFYRFVRQYDVLNELHVYYREEPHHIHVDPETGIPVPWTFEEEAGYIYHVLDGDPGNDILLFQQQGYSLVIFNGYKNNFSILAKLMRKEGACVALRLDTVSFGLPWYNILLRQCLLLHLFTPYDHFLVTGSASKKYLERLGIERRKIGAFPYSVDRVLFRTHRQRKEGLPDNERSRTLLIVAKFIERENPLEALEAFCKLSDRSLTLILAGDGRLRTKLELQSKRFPDRKILFTGYVCYQDLPELYRRSAVFIHPAKHEPWGVSVQEALACGCCVVCSDRVGSAQDLIKPGFNGFIYRSGHVDELVDCLLKALRAPTKSVLKTSVRTLEKITFPKVWAQILQVAADSQITHSSPNQDSGSSPG